MARQALLASQSELSDLARALYQQSGSDPLAVVLGAKSLDEAIAGLDGISRAAGQNNRIVEQARTARTRLAGLTGAARGTGRRAGRSRGRRGGSCGVARRNGGRSAAGSSASCAGSRV